MPRFAFERGIEGDCGGRRGNVDAEAVSIIAQNFERLGVVDVECLSVVDRKDVEMGEIAPARFVDP